MRCWVTATATPASANGTRAPTARSDVVTATPSWPVSGQRPSSAKVIGRDGRGGAANSRGELANELPAMLEEIERLASIDSGSYDVAGVDAVADGFGELFAARGFEVTRTAGRGDRRAASSARADAAPARPRGHGVGGGLAGRPATATGCAGRASAT